MKKNDLIIIGISFLFFFLFMETCSAKTMHSGVDGCVANHTCLPLCEWDNNTYHSYLYYFPSNDTWAYTWYDDRHSIAGPNFETGATLPTKNIVYQSDQLKKAIIQEGKCPAGAYVSIIDKPKLCLDDRTYTSVDTNGVPKTFCYQHTEKLYNDISYQLFSGTSKLIFDVNDQVEAYFHSKFIPMIKGLSCDAITATDFAKSRFVVDENKVQSFLDNVALLFSHNFLYDNPLPYWLKRTYDSEMKAYKEEVTERVHDCNALLLSQATNELSEGKISQKEFDEIKKRHPLVEEKIKDNLDQLEQNINEGKNPSKPDYTPNKPIQNTTEANCKNLLGPETMKMLKTALTVLQIGGVILAIILGMMDFVGAVISGDSDANKKASKKLITRVLLAGVLFLVPTLIKFILNVFGMNGESICIL